MHAKSPLFFDNAILGCLNLCRVTSPPNLKYPDKSDASLVGGAAEVVVENFMVFFWGLKGVVQCHGDFYEIPIAIEDHLCLMLISSVR